MLWLPSWISIQNTFTIFDLQVRIQEKKFKINIKMAAMVAILDFQEEWI